MGGVLRNLSVTWQEYAEWMARLAALVLILSIACFVFLIVSLSIGIANRHNVIRRDATNPVRTVNDFDRWMTELSIKAPLAMKK